MSDMKNDDYGGTAIFQSMKIRPFSMLLQGLYEKDGSVNTCTFEAMASQI